MTKIEILKAVTALKKLVLTGLLAVVLMVQNQYMRDGIFYVDFTLQGENYEGVTYDDMYDMLNSACCEDAENQQ